MNRSKIVPFLRWSSLAAILASSTAAMAQDPAAQAPAQQPAAPRPAPPLSGSSDHDLFVGHLGFGFFGTRAVQVGPVAAGNPALAAPVVGLRYWLTPMIGIDGGIGFMTTSGSTTNAAGVSVDDPSRTAFVLHGGVPLALASSGHFSFLVTPELDVGFGSGSNPGAGGAAATDLSGFLLQVGARVGGELHFGFIGVPQLAIDASVGAFLRSASNKATNAGVSSKASELSIATLNVSQPWDIFRSDVAVLYYF
jgi:hypothetical protein